MKIAVLCVGGTVFLLLLLLWFMTNTHFRIGSRHLKITVFNLPVRRIPLDQISNVSKREPKGRAEYWYSTFKASHRLLTVERKKGFRRYVCITPTNRYVFLADLKSAIRRVDPGAEWAAPKAHDDPRQPAESEGKEPEAGEAEGTPRTVDG